MYFKKFLAVSFLLFANTFNTSNAEVICDSGVFDKTRYHNTQHISSNVCVKIASITLRRAFLTTNPRTITGYKWLTDSYNEFEYTDQIPLIKTYGFVVEFHLKGLNKSLEQVNLKVNFPSMYSSDQNIKNSIDRFETVYLEKDAGIVEFAYIFNHEWELIEGRWDVQIYNNEELLGSVSIDTIKPKSD